MEVVVTMEEAGVKENVIPGGGFWDKSRTTRKERLAQELRGKDRGVLAPISSRGNGGSVDALGWLKDRVSQKKLASKSSVLDSGSKRHQRRLGSVGLSDSKLPGGLGKPSGGLASKEVGGVVGGKENSSGVLHPSPTRPTGSALHSRIAVDHSDKPTKNQVLGSRVQSGAKSPWAANRGGMEIYQDDAMIPQDERDSNRRQSNAKSAEKKGPNAAAASCNGNATKLEQQQQVQEIQEEAAAVKVLSPRRSYGEGSSGLWSGSRVPGTPYKQKLHRPSSSVDDRPDMRSSRDQQFGRGGPEAVGNSRIPRGSVSSVDRRGTSRMEVTVEAAAERISPIAAGTGVGSGRVTGSELSSQINQKVFSSKLEELKFRIRQQTGMPMYSRKAPGSVDSGRSSTVDKLESLYTYASALPEKNAKVGISPSLETSRLGGTDSQKPIYAADNNNAAGLRHSPPHNGGAESFRKADPCEQGIPTNAVHNSGERPNNELALTRSPPPPSKTHRPSTLTAPPSSSVWSHCSATARSLQLQQEHPYPSAHVTQDDGTKWNSTSNMDTVGPGSALHLSSEVTGASSSGSSSTPCVMGNSSFDDVTVKSRAGTLPTPSLESALPSHQLSGMKLRRINRHAKRSLGPPLRVPIDDADSCSSRVSPAPVAPILESNRSPPLTAKEEVGKNNTQLEIPLSDPRKRKAERDPTGGSGDTSQSIELRSSGPPPAQEKDILIAVAVQTQRQYARESRVGLETIHSELPSQASAEEEDADEPADMSCGGFPSQANKENIPIPAVPTPDMSLCLSSLSLGEEDMREKGLSKVTSKASTSPIPCSAPSPQATTLKSVENLRPPPSRLAVAGSGSSVESGSRDRVCPSPGTNAVALPIKAEVKVRPVPPERVVRVQDSGASVERLSHGTGAEGGKGAAPAANSQKTCENLNFVFMNNKRYQKLGKIGKGGSSEVFKVIDTDCNIYALKKINLKGREHRSALGFYQEIEYLEKFIGKRNVIQLIGYEVTNRAVIREDYEEEKIQEDAYIYMVLEFGEIDLAGILIKKRREMMESNENFDDNWLRFYWKHMLLAVKTIHDERIVHADLKPANFLLVKGELKLIDFGIAKAIQNDTTHIVRDSQVGTLNYMSPEAFMANSMDEEGRMVKCGRSSDIWSLGCILYQMVYGHTPFSKVDSFYAKIQAITSKNHKIEFPPIPDPWLQDVMKKCLTWDRHSRPHITDLLEHPFLRPELANQQKFAA